MGSDVVALLREAKISIPAASYRSIGDGYSYITIFPGASVTRPIIIYEYPSPILVTWGDVVPIWQSAL